jgi:ABC-type Mn2+/Zn2+ transport system permease subunit
MSTEALVVSVATAVAAGLTGSFAVMRRMSLAADALSHVALPGIGLALMLHVSPLAGALVMLFLGALLVWGLEDQARVSIDAVVGIVFSAALAIGSMLTKGSDLVDLLFGQRGEPSWGEALFGLATAAVVVVFVLRRRHHLVIALVSPDLARTSGINVRMLNLVYLEMFALSVALGLRHLGILLMGSLIIIPAATARRLATHLSQMLLVSALVAAGATIAGWIVAPWIHQEPGPVIVTIAAAGFLLTFLRPAR